MNNRTLIIAAGLLTAAAIPLVAARAADEQSKVEATTMVATSTNPEPSISGCLDDIRLSSLQRRLLVKYDRGPEHLREWSGSRGPFINSTGPRQCSGLNFIAKPTRGAESGRQARENFWPR